MAFGEILGGASNAGAKRDFIIPWIGAGSLGTKFGIAPGGGAGATNGGWNYFSSRHSGITNFAFGDGSIRSLRPGASGSDWYILQAMSGMMDGEVYDSGRLSN